MCWVLGAVGAAVSGIALIPASVGLPPTWAAAAQLLGLCLLTYALTKLAITTEDGDDED